MLFILLSSWKHNVAVSMEVMEILPEFKNAMAYVTGLGLSVRWQNGRSVSEL